MTCVASGSGASRPCRTRSSIAARKAASVLPDPVGAAMRVWRPALIAGQASACPGVGEAKLSANQFATAGWNSDWIAAGSRDAGERLRAPVRAGEVEAKSASKRLGSPRTRRSASEVLYRAPPRSLAPPASFSCRMRRLQPRLAPSPAERSTFWPTCRSANDEDGAMTDHARLIIAPTIVQRRSHLEGASVSRCFCSEPDHRLTENTM